LNTTSEIQRLSSVNGTSTYRILTSWLVLMWSQLFIIYNYWHNILKPRAYICSDKFSAHLTSSKNKLNETTFEDGWLLGFSAV
jgi:hypothetical protein